MLTDMPGSIQMLDAARDMCTDGIKCTTGIMIDLGKGREAYEENHQLHLKCKALVLK